MSSKQLILFTLINLWVYREIASLELSDISKVFGYIKEGVQVYTTVKKEVMHSIPANEIIEVIHDTDQEKQLKKLSTKIDELSKDVRDLKSSTDEKLDRLEKFLAILPDLEENFSLVNKIRDALTIIHTQQGLFDHYVTNGSSFNKDTLLQFADTVTSPTKNGLEVNLNQISSVIVPDSGLPFGTTIFDLIYEYRGVIQNDTCSSAYYSQQTLFDLYRLVVSTELVSLSMINYAYSILTICREGSRDVEIAMAQERTFNRLFKYHSSFAEIMKMVPRVLPVCANLQRHIPGETYIEMTSLTQIMITPNQNLINENSCRGSCENIDTLYPPSCTSKTSDKCPTPRVCHGRLHSCFKLGDTRVCESTDPTRRYDWFTDGKDKKYGRYRKGACNTNVRKYSSWSWFFHGHCEFCACVCSNADERSKNQQFFSFLKSQSDTNKNKVVSGVRFKREDNVLYVEIKQSVLYGNGYINHTTDEWVPAPKLKDYVKKMQQKNENVEPWYKYGRGKYFDVITEKNNAIYLGDVILDSVRCLTGVRLTSGSNGVKLSVQSAAFDPDSGQLKEDSMVWTDAHTDASEELKLGDADNPLLANQPNVEDSTANQFVKFTFSSLIKDGGQSVIPFLDAQKQTTNPSVPLGGLGLYHKGVEGFGGFVAFKLFSVNYKLLLKQGSHPDHQKAWYQIHRLLKTVKAIQRAPQYD